MPAPTIARARRRRGHPISRTPEFASVNKGLAMNHGISEDPQEGLRIKRVECHWFPIIDHAAAKSPPKKEKRENIRTKERGAVIFADRWLVAGVGRRVSAPVCACVHACVCWMVQGRVPRLSSPSQIEGVKARAGGGDRGLVRKGCGRVALCGLNCKPA